MIWFRAEGCIDRAVGTIEFTCRRGMLIGSDLTHTEDINHEMQCLDQSSIIRSFCIVNPRPHLPESERSAPRA